MRCIVLLYTFCLYFRLFEFVPTSSSEVRRIIGGHDADEDKYQYVVRLQYEIIAVKDGIIDVRKQLHQCTAAVITPIWSLTAAHCIAETGSVVINKTSVTSRPVVIHGPQKRRTISKVIHTVKHPAYKKGFVLYNDIALIRHEIITLKEYARVSGLDYRTMVGQEVTLIGYGKTNITVKLETGNPELIEDASDANITMGIFLQYLDAVVVHCEKNTGSSLDNFRGMCLARACGKLSGLCPGDSGGPVLHQSGVVGVNSIGSQQLKAFCSLKPHQPFYDAGGFTPTSPYIDWISSTIIKEVPKRKSIMHKYPKTRKLRRHW